MTVCFVIRRKHRRKIAIVCITFCVLYMASASVWLLIVNQSLRGLSGVQTGWTFLLRESGHRQVLEARQCLQIPSVDCQDVFSGNLSYIPEAEHTETANQSSCDLLSLGMDCGSLKKFLGYLDKPLSPTEADFPIAYSIRMHKDPEQVEMLLRAIYMPQNVYCIYIDKKSPAHVHRSMELLANCFPNVFIASRLEPFYYATSSQMEADLQCMRDLLDTPVPWKYYLNLAGQEFPLRTNREIVGILTLLNGTNDIEVGEYKKGLRWRYLSRVVPDAESGFRFDGPKRDRGKLGLTITLHKGSGYGAFSRAFVLFLLSDARVQRLRHWLLDTFAPEETLFATANTLPGAPGGYPVYVDQSVEVGQHISRVVLWKWTKHPPCKGELVRGVCILACRDLEWLIQRPQLFANKFDVTQDKTAIQCLLHRLLSSRSKITQPDFKYLYSLPHVKYTYGLH